MAPPPPILIRHHKGRVMAQGGIHIVFYMAGPTSQLAPSVRLSLDAYRRFVGPDTLCLYADLEGDWQELDSQGWELTWQNLFRPQRAHVSLLGNEKIPSEFGFDYDGKDPEDELFRNRTNRVSTASFWLPMSFLGSHGPDRIRDLAVELGSLLPFNSGHAGLSFNAPFHIAGVMEGVSKEAFRYPGVDILDLSLQGREIGTRVRVPHWLTFLGDPVLTEVGGIEALRARLHEPGTTVEAINPQRAVVTLGHAPTPGEEGQPLPAYRELARVLEPWAYHPKSCPGFSPQEAFSRWERRFLD